MSDSDLKDSQSDEGKDLNHISSYDTFDGLDSNWKNCTVKESESESINSDFDESTNEKLGKVLNAKTSDEKRKFPIWYSVLIVFLVGLCAISVILLGYVMNDYFHWYASEKQFQQESVNRRASFETYMENLIVSEKGKLDILKNQSAEMENHLANMKDLISQYSEKYKESQELQRDINNLTKNIQSLSSEFDSKKQELDTIQKEYLDVSAKLDTTIDAYNKLSENKKNAENDLNSIQVSITKEKQNKKDIDQKLEEAKSQLNNLKSDISDLQLTKEQLESLTSSAEIKLHECESSYSKLKQENIDLNKQLEEKNKSLTGVINSITFKEEEENKLELSIASLQKEQKDLIDRNLELSTSFSSTKTSLDVITEELERNKIINDKLKSDIDAYKSINESLQKNNKILENEAIDLQKSINEKVSSKSKIDEEIKGLIEEYTSLQERFNITSQILKDLEEKNKEISSNISLLEEKEKSLKVIESSIKVKQKQLSDLEIEINDSYEKLGALKTKIQMQEESSISMGENEL